MYALRESVFGANRQQSFFEWTCEGRRKSVLQRVKSDGIRRYGSVMQSGCFGINLGGTAEVMLLSLIYGIKAYFFIIG